MRELQRQKAVVLARCPQRSEVDVEMHLRRAPVGTARLLGGTLRDVIGARTDVRGGRGVVIRDLPRPDRIADIEYAYARIQIAANQCGGPSLVVHAAVMAAVQEACKAQKGGGHL